MSDVPHVALLLSLALTSARSAERSSLFYATLPSTPLSQLAAFSLEANRGRVIGNIGFTLSAALTFCPPGKRAYTITNIFGEPTIDGGTGLGPPQLATLNLGTGAAALVGSPLPLWQTALASQHPLPHGPGIRPAKRVIKKKAISAGKKKSATGPSPKRQVQGTDRLAEFIKAENVRGF